jgi:hypothetical protein
MMPSDIAKNAVERSRLQRPMVWNGDGMLAVLLCPQPHVVRALADTSISEALQRSGEFLAIKIPRQLGHRAIPVGRPATGGEILIA